MPLPLAFPDRSSYPFDDPTTLTWIGTTSTGTNTKTVSSPGVTVGDFSTGVAAVTFPPCKYAVDGGCTENVGGVAAVNHLLVLKDIVASAGTANLYCALSTDGTLESPAAGGLHVQIRVTF